MGHPFYGSGDLGRVCEDCGGTGRSQAKTEAARRAGRCDSHSYIECWSCNGNGLDPAKFFRWTDHTQEKVT